MIEDILLSGAYGIKWYAFKVMRIIPKQEIQTSIDSTATNTAQTSGKASGVKSNNEAACFNQADLGRIKYFDNIMNFDEKAIPMEVIAKIKQEVHHATKVANKRETELDAGCGSGRKYRRVKNQITSALMYAVVAPRTPHGKKKGGNSADQARVRVV